MHGPHLRGPPVTGGPAVRADPKRDGNSDLVCKREVITGTHLPEWICRYRADAEDAHKKTQVMMLKLTPMCPRYECIDE